MDKSTTAKSEIRVDSLATHLIDTYSQQRNQAIAPFWSKFISPVETEYIVESFALSRSLRYIPLTAFHSVMAKAAPSILSSAV